MAGELTAEEAAEAKLWITETEWEILDRCLQLHGGYGYINEYEIARAVARRTRAASLRRHDRDHEGHRG